MAPETYLILHPEENNGPDVPSQLSEKIPIKPSTSETSRLDLQQLDDTAAKLANAIEDALNILYPEPAFQSFNPSLPLSPDDILAMPFSDIRIDGSLVVPSHKSTHKELADTVAWMLYPCPSGSKAPLVRYGHDRVKIRSWAAVQRKYDALKNSKNRRLGIRGDEALAEYLSEVAEHLIKQGPWDPSKFPISAGGVLGIPMPVNIASAKSLRPFFDHLKIGGQHEALEGRAGKDLNGGLGDIPYGTKGVEYEKGVIYADGRMDLCKMVVGPDHIENLMESLKLNEFVRHFLLGNNIIGPLGAKAIAAFIGECPDRMDTWYLAGNCIDGPSFRMLVDALILSPAVTNVWLKRNPLKPGAVGDVYRLITETPNLRTLDLDQTELGDIGITQLFSKLAAFKRDDGGELPLKHLYLNGLGISTDGAEAVGRFFSSETCGVTSIYLSHNPIGDTGAIALGKYLGKASALERLCMQSVGISSAGASAIFKALAQHPNLRMLDLSQAYQTIDLGQAFNYINDSCAPGVIDFLEQTPSLEFFCLGPTPMEPATIRAISNTASHHPALLYLELNSVFPDRSIPPPRFIPVQDKFTEQAAWTAMSELDNRIQKEVRQRLEANVKAKYGGRNGGEKEMSYRDFITKEKRFLVNDKEDIRKIDSVYRNRDAGMAKKGLMKLAKRWVEGDNTLDQVMAAAGPICCSRQRRG
ncbi:hypothetical protein MKZ38_007763 [Zalerion maritima]|uniref:RNI-like protein n=1 Tax=Zalerion maritima TaxID=339359 RepID=A0AAD5RVR5_9PEZI|nr:hypothetical protein MKZ38_007763 [Zalerion maritima]